MKKICIYLFFCIFFLQVSFAQTSVTSYDGVIYTVGDTIQIGMPRYGADGYEFIYDITPTEYSDIKYYLKANKEKYQFKFVVIDKVSPKEENNIFSSFEESPLLQTRIINSSDTLFINLDYAIANKELVRTMKEKNSNDECLTTHESLAIYHKVFKKEISDEDLLRYITSKNKELGEECAQNNFKFHKVKSEWKADFDKAVTNVDFNKTYFIEHLIKLGDYDFDKLGYWVYYDEDEYRRKENIFSFNPLTSSLYLPYSFF